MAALPTPTLPPPIPPPGTRLVSVGYGTITLTYQNGDVSTVVGNNQLVVSTSYYDAAQASSYSQALQSWSSQLQYLATASLATTATAGVLQPSATQPSVASTQFPIQTAPVRPPKDTQSSNDVPVGVIIAVCITCLLCAALGIAFWLWCRRLRVGRFGLGKTYARRNDKEKAKREARQSINSSNSFLLAERKTVNLETPSTTAPTWSSSASTLQPETSPELAVPLSPITEEPTYQNEPLSPASVRSMHSMSAIVAPLHGVREGEIVGKHDVPPGSADEAASATGSLLHISRREGPRPGTSSSSIASPLFAAMSKSRPVTPSTDFTVKQSFEAPKDRGLIVSLGENTFDWKHFSSHSEEERVCEAKSTSEEDSASGLRSATPFTTYDSQRDRTQDGFVSPGPSDTGTAYNFGMSSFGESFLPIRTGSSGSSMQSPHSVATTLVAPQEQSSTQGTLEATRLSSASSLSSLATVTAAHLRSVSGSSLSSTFRETSTERHRKPFAPGTQSPLSSEVTLVPLSPVARSPCPGFG